jgi:hypothetical protein
MADDDPLDSAFSGLARSPSADFEGGGAHQVLSHLHQGEYRVRPPPRYPLGANLGATSAAW